MTLHCVAKNDTAAVRPAPDGDRRQAAHVPVTVAHLVRAVARVRGRPIGRTADELVQQALRRLGGAPVR